MKQLLLTVGGGGGSKATGVLVTSETATIFLIVRPPERVKVYLLFQGREVC